MPSIIPDPLRHRFAHGDFLQRPSPLRRGFGALVDHLAAAERQAARRADLYHRLDTGERAPMRWQRSEPRPSIQYAGAMTTEAARDPRLARGAVSLLLILRARAGNGRRTETCKTTLAHILRVSTRTIGRWLRDLVRFGYVTARPRTGAGGLYTGLVLHLADKVLPCFRQLSWVAGWIAHTLLADGANPDGTVLSHTNHFYKDSSFNRACRSTAMTSTG